MAISIPLAPGKQEISIGAHGLALSDARFSKPEHGFPGRATPAGLGVTDEIEGSDDFLHFNDETWVQDRGCVEVAMLI